MQSMETDNKILSVRLSDVAALSAIAIPACASQLLTVLSQNLGSMFVGHYLGPDALTAYSVSLRVVSTLGVKIGVGLAYALDTLCAHEHGRDRTSQLHGVYVLRCLALQCFVVGLDIVLFVVCAPAVEAAIFPAPVGSLAGRFIRFGPCYVAPMLVGTCLGKALQSIGLPGIHAKATMISVVGCLVFNYLFTTTEIEGAGVALALTALTQAIAVAAIVSRVPRARHALGASCPSVANVLCVAELKTMLRLGLPSVGVVVAETTPFTTMVLFAAMIGGADSAAYNVAYNVVNLLFTTSYGMAGAAAAQVGNALGANNPSKARRLALVAILMTGFVAVVNILVFVAFHTQLYRFWTNDEAVIRVAQSLVLPAAAMHLFDCLQFVFQGIFSACGKNNVSFPIMLLTEVGVSVPLAGVLALQRGFGATGLFVGLGCGLAVSFPCYCVVVFHFFDFDAIATIASKRAQRDQRGNLCVEEDPRHDGTHELLPSDGAATLSTP